ncbi:lys-63-specific deubiquitinase BRCC36 isoform X1 [Hydra vulgaris]|uniref:lys-63-specific deubiquitinase BRCC36 isoform X1 n=1 Tax=Hydra vulgaris TaxID=6087 RepID=UPI0001926D6A|nr:lys-63-specific deubiquitinase BRCC36 [Hydra vulgaris]
MLKKVKIESDVLHVCIAHALTNEREEIMGLLIGQVEDDVSHIHALVLLERLDKQKDRVEISPEQLCNAAMTAEKLGERTRLKQPMRIIGWYHSHPHITVWPSHVDVQTQHAYQLMDKDFIGLIVSCFNQSDQSKMGEVRVTCFQAVKFEGNDSYERVEIEQEIVSTKELSHACLQELTKLPEILLQEEISAYQESLSYADQDVLTAVQNSAVYTQAVTKIIEIICTPIFQLMESRLAKSKMKQNELIRKLKVEGRLQS